MTKIGREEMCVFGICWIISHYHGLTVSEPHLHIHGGRLALHLLVLSHASRENDGLFEYFFGLPSSHI